jgi:S-adenosylmethionine:tRNA ribosyltransferase-isomerase
MRRTDDYDYHLPAEQIAQVPADRRDASRLLHLPAGPANRDAPHDCRFRDLPTLLPADAVVVVNDTLVIPARLRARKRSGGQVDLLLAEPDSGSQTRWRCLARASKPIRAGCELAIGDQFATVVEARGADGSVVVEFPVDALELARERGEIPLPPYISRAAGPTGRDAERYQTVYAREPGAVAAPTAGLHFTPEILSQLAIYPLTLHVGPGTFAPVRAERIDDHAMHRERYHIPDATFEAVVSGRPVVAVGTTVVRALESAGGPGPGETDLFITPGYAFRRVDLLVTNFHLPRSTLLMLVCAFAGRERVLDAYRHAVTSGYRFFSYGDAMLVEP